LARLKKAYLVAAILFGVAVLPRLPGLARFLTSDENTNIFFAGSNVIAAFLRGDFRGTYWHFYPGVTMSWLDAVGMAGQYGLDALRGKALPPFTEYIYGDILSLIVANRLPYALLTAAAVSAVYLLARWLLPGRVALLGALFIAFDPFYLAHSRVAHGDAPVAVFMSLSALSFFIYLLRVDKPAEREGIAGQIRRVLAAPFLLISAICGGLAALTKAPGPFMALFIMGLCLLYSLLELRNLKNQQLQPLQTQAPRPMPHILRIITHWFIIIAAWGLISLATFIMLWPAMWVDPLGTFGQMWDETFSKVNEGHLVYFFGQPTLDPGPWFYLYVIPFRLTPITLLGAIFSLCLLIPQLNAHPAIQKLINPNGQGLLQSPHFLLWLFTLTLLLFGSLSPKKQDRYLLPLFPFLDLLAATGWLGLISIINYQLPITNYQLLITNAQSLRSNSLSLILLLFHFGPVMSYYPYYLTYFNPLMGGPVRAAQTTLMGWGEGMEQVAAYLNARPNAASLYVASTPSQTLLPYFAGTGENFYTNDIAFRADYVVLYLAQMQRLAPSPEIIRYFESREPEKTIMIHEVTYARIYPGPKFILPDMPPEATPSNIGLDDLLRLAGYERRYSPETQSVTLTLYWHALAPLPANYTISVRGRAEDGRVLVQQDQWPVNGLLPTSQWRQGDYVVDTHTLDLSGDDIVDVSEFEIVVYQTDAGKTLGPPLTIPNDED
jgi:hypothetical protein